MVFIALKSCFAGIVAVSTVQDTGCVVDCVSSAVAMLVFELFRLAPFLGGGWGAAGCSPLSARFFVCERVLADLKRNLNQRYSAEYVGWALRDVKK